MKKQRWRFTKGYWVCCHYCGTKIFISKHQEEDLSHDFKV
jgi:hypothetical protein